MKYCDIIQLIGKEKFEEALKKLLDKKAMLSSPDNEVYILLYLLYEILNDTSNKKQQFSILKKIYKGKTGELYYQLAKNTNDIFKRNFYLYYSPLDVDRHLKKAIQIDPNHVNALFMLGKREIKEKKISGFEYLKKATSIKTSKLADKLNCLVQMHISPHDSKKFLEAAMTELEEYEKYKDELKNDYFIKLVEVYTALGKYQKALDTSRFYKIDKERENREIHFSLMNLHLAMKNYDKTIEHASKIDYWETAECYFAFEKYNEAATQYEKYLNSKSQKNHIDLVILNKIAESYIKCDEYQSAFSIIKKINNDPSSKLLYIYHYLNSLLLKGNILYNQKKYTESLKKYDKAYTLLKDKQDEYQKDYDMIIRRDKESKDLYEELIIMLITVHAELYSSFLYKQKNDINAVQTIGNTIDDYESLIGQLNIIRRPITRNKEEYDRFVNEFLLYSQDHKKIKLIEDGLKKKQNELNDSLDKKIVEISINTLKKNPDNEIILSKLATSYLNLKKWNKSVNIYQKLLKKNKESPAYLNNIAYGYTEFANYKKAEKFYLKSISIGKYHKDILVIYENILNFYLKYIKSVTSVKKRKEINKKVNLYFNKIVIHNIAESSRMASIWEKRKKKLVNNIIYKYKPFNVYTLNSLINKTLFFSSLDKLNDPLDIPLLRLKDMYDLQNAEIGIKDFTIFSATYEKCNTLMWAHYADSHQGICIGYKVTSLPERIGWNNINYVEQNFDYKRLVKGDSLITAGLYSKQNYWEYEKEVRLVRFKESNDLENYTYPIEPYEKNKTIEAYIAEVLLGYQFTDTNLKILIPILQKINRKRKKLGIEKIKLYKTNVQKNKPFNLELEELPY